MKRKRNGLFYSKKEETINSISHGIGIAMGVIVSTLFLIKCYQAQNLWAACGVWLYLFGMGGSYLASTLYHSLKHHNPWNGACGIGTMQPSIGTLQAVTPPSHSLH